MRCLAPLVPLALTAVGALTGCGDDACPAGSTRAGSGLCVLDDTGEAPAGTDGADGTADGADGADGGTGVVFLGGGTHSVANVEFTEVVGPESGLLAPRDLAFDPFAFDRLWVVDRQRDAVVIVTNPGTAEQSTWLSEGDERAHWLAQPSALAFGQEGFLATAHDSDNGFPDVEDASLHMGPTLWPSDPTDFDGGRPSHLDMVHDSALMGGIAWQSGNVYWIHDGYNGCLTRLDFAAPHEPGGTDHNDADVDRFVCGEVGYVEGVPAHMEWDPEAERLWFADPERGHVAWLDPSTGVEGAAITGADAAQRNLWTGASLVPLETGDALTQPSGLALYDGLILVSDPATSRLIALNQDGEVVDWLDTRLPAGVLAGITVGPDGALWVVDQRNARVLRYAAP